MSPVSCRRSRLSTLTESNKNTIFAILLIGLILLLTPSYLRWVSPPQQETPLRPADIEQSKSAAESPATKLPNFSRDGEEIDKKSIDRLNEIIVHETIVSIETPYYFATLSSLGGGRITRWVLKDYIGLNNEPVVMINTLDSKNLGVRIVDANRDTIDFSDFNWAPTYENLSMLNIGQGETREVSFYTRSDNGSIIRKIFTFNGDSYDFSLSIDVSGLREATINNRYSLYWETPLLSTEEYLTNDSEYARALALLGEDIEEIDATPGEIKYEHFDGSVSWAAARTKYFTAAVIPPPNQAGRVMLKGTARTTSGDEVYKSYRFSLEIPVENQFTGNIHRFRVYIGPLSLETLKSYNVQLEKMMNFGWGFIRPISKAALWVFVQLHKIIPNYGFVIIVFSILVKILVYPLTHKSYVSMKKMQDLQPVIAELKEKYKDDQPTLQKKQMALFKEYGVNPLGGCLPMLLQMPLLFALFTLFRSTIELRGAEFIWWIKDLSSQDTLFTLPFPLPIYAENVNFLLVFMGETMYFQQKFSGQATATQQQKMMGYFMPVFMVLFFNTFPSGLNLYYSLFNIFSVIQTKYLSDGFFSRGKSEKNS